MKQILKLNEIPKSVFLIIPINLFGIVAIYYILVGEAPAWWVYTTLIGFILQKEIGIATGYHRLFSHGSFKVNRIIKIFILWCGSIAGQGSVFFWATTHRGYHHRYADTDKDPHSPNHGFWHSYIFWLLKIREKDLSIKPIIDLVKDKDLTFFHKYYNVILFVSHTLVAVINVDFWIYFMALPMFLTFHVFCIQTSLVHNRAMGYRNYDTKDNSVNSPILFLLSQGECWHNNHHGEVRNPNFGGRRWWEIDPTYWLIKILQKNS